MKDVELRWVANRISPHYKQMTLQYRVFKDQGGPYPNYWWSDWMDVPTVEGEDKSNERKD